MHKAFCDSGGVPPAVVSEGSPFHTLHTHELLQEILEEDSSLELMSNLVTPVRKTKIFMILSDSSS